MHASLAEALRTALGTRATLQRYVRERSVLSLGEAVAKMTSRPARAFALHDRGVIRPGAVADLVALDAGILRETATFRDPELVAEGVA